MSTAMVVISQGLYGKIMTRPTMVNASFHLACLYKKKTGRLSIQRNTDARTQCVAPS